MSDIWGAIFVLMLIFAWTVILPVVGFLYIIGALS